MTFISTHSHQTQCHILTALLQVCAPNKLLFLYTDLDGQHSSKFLNSQIVTPDFSLSLFLIALSESNPDNAQPSSAMSFALNKSWFIISLADSSIKVFSTHSGVLARTLVGDESGMWVVCLVGKGGEV